MIRMLAQRTLGDRPRRTAILLLGLGIAVGVMITLLSIGQAVLVQAEDKALVGGGDLLLLPAGIDVEVMKIGGPTGMYSMLDNARFLFRQVLSGPRFAGSLARLTPEYAALPLAAASPGLVEKVVYVRKVGAASAAASKALAHGFIPSLDVAAGGPTAEFLRQGIAWSDNHSDRMWVDPPVDSLYNDMDRFHLPARTLPDLDRWAEWLYFNFAGPSGVFGYVSMIVGGDIETGQGRGGPLLQIQEPGKPPRRFTVEFPLEPGAISLEHVDLRLGEHNTAIFRDGAYRLHLEWDEQQGPVRADLVVRPLLDLYYPPVLLHESERFVSGYTVPALRTTVSGTIHAPGVYLELHDAPGYHDHNWGTWRSVNWEWGTASSDAGAHVLLYGRIQHPDIDPGRAGAGIFLLLAQGRTASQRGGVLALFRPREIHYEWKEAPELPGHPERVPARLLMQDAREAEATAAISARGDRIAVEIGVEAVTTTPPRPGEELVFLQLRGHYSVQAQIAGRELRFDTPGFAEVFVPPRAAGTRPSSP